MLVILVPILMIPTIAGIVLLWQNAAEFNVISFGVSLVEVAGVMIAISWIKR